MMVISLDPVGKTASMVSIPRDMVFVPLGNGDDYGPKINSLLGYAQRNPDQFPNGPMRTLQDAIGALLGIPIHYYARIDFKGFINMVDSVGGVDIKVKKDMEDPSYDGYGINKRGWSITKGRHRLDGVNALAYARIRKAAGESDFTRAARQQEILVAMRSRVSSGTTLLFDLPDLLTAVGDTLRTDIPIAALPDLIVTFESVDSDRIARAVIRHPLVRSESTRTATGWSPSSTRSGRWPPSSSRSRVSCRPAWNRPNRRPRRPNRPSDAGRPPRTHGVRDNSESRALRPTHLRTGRVVDVRRVRPIERDSRSPDLEAPPGDGQAPTTHTRR